MANPNEASGGSGGTMQAGQQTQPLGGMTQQDFALLGQRRKAATSIPEHDKYLAVMLARRAGWDPAQISATFDLNLGFVNGCINAYNSGGVNELTRWQWDQQGGGSGQNPQSR
jgi:hypothetical protein